jgi:aryl-alcohol dehydrogenase-like predicted oxidoreductase
MARQLDHYRLLGRSGLRVSPLSLGAMTFGLGGPAWGSTEDEARRIFDTYVDRGGNFVDTANFYGDGGSEKALGDYMKGRRHRIVLSTKYSNTMSPGDPNASGNHRKNMIRSVEDSLKRLGTDYIDLYYLHIWDLRTPVDEILRGFDDLVSAGKILYPGISDSPVWQVSRMQAIADLRGWAPFVALQVPYSLIRRTVEMDFMPMAHELGLGVIPWSPLAMGVLSGKYSREDLNATSSIATMDSRKDINVVTGNLNPHALDVADIVKDIAAELGRTSSQVAIAWTMLQPSVTSPLMGVRTLAQLEDNLGALDLTFSAGQIDRLNAASPPARHFPYDQLETPMHDFILGHVTVEKRR